MRRVARARTPRGHPPHAGRDSQPVEQVSVGAGVPVPEAMNPNVVDAPAATLPLYDTLAAVAVVPLEVSVAFQP